MRTTSTSRSDVITESIIGAAVEVHRHTGPGMLESVYEECPCYELSQLGLKFQRHVPLPVLYKGVKLDCGYKLDLVVEDAVVLELKAVERLLPVHEAQLLTYLKPSSKKVGLLLNFNSPILTKGLKRIVNQFRDASTSACSAPQSKSSASRRLGGEIISVVR